MQYKAVIFDAYGTLFNLGDALGPATEKLGGDAEAVLFRWRTLQLEYAWLSGLGRQYIDFEAATRHAFIDALAEKSIEDADLVDQLVEGFKKVSAFPDAVQTLEALKNLGCTTAILSNGSPSILASASSHAGLDQHLDKVLSVDSARTYKPAPEAYSVATISLNIDAEEALFVSSNWWDVNGARNFGFQTIWIDRGAYQWPPSVPKPKNRVEALADLISFLA